MTVQTDLLASVVEVVAQSLVYGVFVVLMPISTVLLLKRGWKSRNGVIMLSMIWIMFALSTAHWAVGLAFLVTKVKSPVEVTGTIRALSDLMNAIVTINFGVADAVVIWRAWILCREDFRKLLIISFGGLGLTSASIIATIALRIAANANVHSNGRDNKADPVVLALDIVQIVSIGVSMCTNVLSTGIVGFYVWKYRQFLRESLQRNQTTRSERILVLLVESGFFYSFYTVFSIICSGLRVSIGTVGDVTNSVLVHISGVYPTLIITLVSVQGTVNSSTLSSPSTHTVGRIPHSSGIVFARPSPMRGSTQLEMDHALRGLDGQRGIST